jgi:D-hexose-6-phosphate mutarotase
VTFLEGQGELPILEIVTPWSAAEIFLHGAHVTRFKKNDDSPLLFMSQCSRFEHGSPIRGGIPIILPWFGFREGLGQHGFARKHTWELKEVSFGPEGSASARFWLPDSPEAAAFPPFKAEYTVTVSDSLQLCLEVTNHSADQVLTLENCLHTYFEVSDVTAISITGLKGCEYLDQVEQFKRKTETQDAIRIGSEVDRIYLNTSAPVEIVDPRLGRRIRIETEGSTSTVVWNPWVAKAQQMADFGNEEYEKMVCVESGNVAENCLSVAPRQKAVLNVKLTSARLAG